MAITLVFALVVRRGKFQAKQHSQEIKTQCLSEWMQTHFSRHCETPQFLHYAAVRQEDEEMPYLAQEWLLVRFTKEN
jgi:hypothetical protein